VQEVTVYLRHRREPMKFLAREFDAELDLRSRGAQKLSYEAPDGRTVRAYLDPREIVATDGRRWDDAPAQPSALLAPFLRSFGFLNRSLRHSDNGRDVRQVWAMTLARRPAPEAGVGLITHPPKVWSLKGPITNMVAYTALDAVHNTVGETRLPVEVEARIAISWGEGG
jgi:hypothetical protein